MATHCLQGRIKISQFGMESPSKSGLHSGLKCSQHSTIKLYQLLKYWSTFVLLMTLNHLPAKPLAHMSPGQTPAGRDETSFGIWHQLPSRHKLGWAPTWPGIPLQCPCVDTFGKCSFYRMPHWLLNALFWIVLLLQSPLLDTLFTIPLFIYLLNEGKKAWMNKGINDMWPCTCHLPSSILKEGGHIGGQVRWPQWPQRCHSVCPSLQAVVTWSGWVGQTLAKFSAMQVAEVDFFSAPQNQQSFRQTHINRLKRHWGKERM